MTKLRMRPSTWNRGLIDDEFETGLACGDADGKCVDQLEIEMYRSRHGGEASGRRMAHDRWDNTPGNAETCSAHTSGTLCTWADPDMPDEAAHGGYGYEFGYNAWREGRLGES